MRRLAAVFGCLALLLLFAVFAVVHPAGVHVLPSLSNPMSFLGIVGMIVIPWQPAMNREELDAVVNPQTVGEPEVVPWQLYDTQSLATANANPLVFYTAQNNDKTLCNMEGAGALPDPQYFVVHYVACDILTAPTVTVAASVDTAVANVENILKTTRATVELNVSNKLYGPFSLTMCHATGGATGFGMAYGTAAGGNSVAVANNGVPGTGGFPFCGALVIPPKINFSATIRFGAAVTIASGPVNVRLSLVGALYRRVL